MPISRRQFLYGSAAAGASLYLSTMVHGVRVVHAVVIPGGTLDPLGVDKFVTPMLIPPVMPRAGTKRMKSGRIGDLYEISVRQFAQQILPANLPATTVWGYGAVKSSVPNGLLIHNAPSLTIEAQAGRPVEVKWINDLVDNAGNYLPHLLPVDPTLHWANPAGGKNGRDTRPTFETTPGRYTGPVPMVSHVHGAVGVGDESDGYPEAWYLPAARNIPAGYATEGTWYRFFQLRAAIANGATWGPGYARFEYPNLNRASTIWYHDHTLGMTRLNVYAGPAGFYLIRGGPDGDGAVRDMRTGRTAVLPGPAPRSGDTFPSNKTYYEIPIAIQDRSFNADGSLFYPDTRKFFDNIAEPYLPGQDPMGGEAFSPIWNPEFFGNAIMVNGSTWPYQTVEQRRYRLRFLNGCQSRFLILDFNGIEGVKAWQIGNEGGFLAKPVNLTADQDNRLLLGLAERADIIVDFTDVPVGPHVLRNVGPDEPFGGGIAGVDFPFAHDETTGQLLQFRVVPAVAADPTTPPQFLRLPAIAPLPQETRTRPLALIEKMGTGFDSDGAVVDGPVAAVLGTAIGGTAVDYQWMDKVTENPAVGDTEIWEFYNTTGDAHPMHVHEVTFEVVNRQALATDSVTNELLTPLQPTGPTRGPEPWETGRKDTVTAYPGEVTRVKATFDKRGQYVWHCHIVEHEDNEMMRPFRIGLRRFGQPR
ncbi:MAG TPA: multicopper oxidase [Candidatus Limnocylindrales bacterium]|nr:multicopper oxidase [Candidatus Limnocylindrales bacterium]